MMLTAAVERAAALNGAGHATALRRLRAELRRIDRRDFFPLAEHEIAHRPVRRFAGSPKLTWLPRPPSNRRRSAGREMGDPRRGAHRAITTIAALLIFTLRWSVLRVLGISAALGLVAALAGPPLT